MPRDAKKVRRRLQEAALKLFQRQGYEQTTAADIAAEAEVTQRTFFRHFSDKREVLFGGEEVFIETLTKAILNASPDLGPRDVLLHAFRSAEPLFIENRSFSAPRQVIIASHPALQERAQTKIRAVIAALATALRQRGVPERLANLAAQVGMAALNDGVAAWFQSGSNDLRPHVEQAFRDVRDLASGALDTPPRSKSGAVRKGRATRRKTKSAVL